MPSIFRLLIPLCAIAAPQLTRADLASSYRDEILPLLETYCYDCHGDGLKKGELALDRYETIESMVAARDVWKRIREHIDFRLMPPPDENDPSEAERQAILAWIDAAVFPVDPENPDPGHVTLRRLNRTEYQNTIRDLLGVEVDVNVILPVDDSGYGFDHIGDVLTLSPLHLERYLDAASTAVGKAIHLGEMPFPRTQVEGNRLEGEGNSQDHGRFFHTNGTASSRLDFPHAGRYTVSVLAGGTPGAGVSPQLDFLIENEVRHTWDVPATMEAPETYSFELQLDNPGPLNIGVAFTNDFWDEHQPDPNQRDRNLMVRRIVVEGPLDGPRQPKPSTHRRIFGEREADQTDEAYFLKVLGRFANRAFRRPPKEGEVERYTVFLESALREGDTVEHAVHHAIEAMLVSPAFLFREEPGSGQESEGRELISEHALASRLSYFLWSSMPDQRLLDLAKEGRLRENLESEIQRLLSHPRSGAFVENFAGQWLQLRDLDSIFPDNRRFPEFDRNLANSMRAETHNLFAHILRENLPVSELLDADYTFVNERLAKHYGLEGVSGNEFQKVSLAGTPRRGILNHGSVLTLTSFPGRTSPVLRGKYVLENILDTPPPPPPPNIPQLEPPGRHGQQASLREQMEKHRDDPSCSSCHALMDPIGFGLENYDAVGSWRDQEHDQPIDASGQLANGRNFVGAEELRRILSEEHREEFHRAVASKLLTYALGRGLEWYDRPAVDGIVLKAREEDGRFLPLIVSIARSVPFQYRRN